MLKKTIYLILAALFIFSCKLEVKPEEKPKAPVYADSWKLVSESNNSTETSRIIYITEDSYEVSVQIKSLIDNEILQKKDQERGTLTNPTDTTFTLSQTHRIEGGKEYLIAPSDQIIRSVSWSVVGDKLTLTDSSTNPLSNVTGEYIREQD